MVEWYQFITFDIMGDFVFGESLGLLQSSTYSKWVETVLDSVKVIPIAQVIHYYPIHIHHFKALEPDSIKKLKDSHFKFSADRIDRRLEIGSREPDIWSHALDTGDSDMAKSGRDALPRDVFMLVGSETTGTVPSSLTFYLLFNRENQASRRGNPLLQRSTVRQPPASTQIPVSGSRFSKSPAFLNGCRGVETERQSNHGNGHIVGLALFPQLIDMRDLSGGKNYQVSGTGRAENRGVDPANIMPHVRLWKEGLSPLYDEWLRNLRDPNCEAQTVFQYKWKSVFSSLSLSTNAAHSLQTPAAAQLGNACLQQRFPCPMQGETSFSMQPV